MNQLDRIERTQREHSQMLDALLGAAGVTIALEVGEMANAADIKAKLDEIAEKETQNGNVLASAENTLTVVTGLVHDLKDQLVNAGVPQELVDQAGALAEQLGAQTAQLATAIANVPTS